MWAAVTKDGYTLYDWNEKGMTQECGKIKTGDIYLRMLNKAMDNLHDLGLILKSGDIGIVSGRLHFRLANGNDFSDFELSTSVIQNPYPEDHDERNIAEARFMPSATMKLEGKITQVFQITDPVELDLYDMLRIENEHLKIRTCNNCEKLFVAHKNQIRCEECRKAGIGEKIKYENRKQNRKYNMRQKIYKIAERHIDFKPYTDSLISVIDRSERFDIDHLDMIHEKFMNLNKYIENPDNEVDLINIWEQKRCSIWVQKEKTPEQWLKDWYKKVGKDWNDMK